jgi:hypothetical protein
MASYQDDRVLRISRQSKAPASSHTDSLWGPQNRQKDYIFQHFAQGFKAIKGTAIPRMTRVAALHGWTVAIVERHMDHE